MSQLDESKPFGQVFGSTAGIRYEQDGCFYDGQKRQVDAQGKVLASAKGTKQKDEGAAEPVTQEPATGATEPAQPAEPKQAAQPKKAAPKKAPAKKSEPEGVKPMRDQVKDEQKGSEK